MLAAPETWNIPQRTTTAMIGPCSVPSRHRPEPDADYQAELFPFCEQIAE
jgi:hypothetical protein